MRTGSGLFRAGCSATNTLQGPTELGSLYFYLCVPAITCSLGHDSGLHHRGHCLCHIPAAGAREGHEHEHEHPSKHPAPGVMCWLHQAAHGGSFSFPKLSRVMPPWATPPWTKALHHYFLLFSAPHQLPPPHALHTSVPQKTSPKHQRPSPTSAPSTTGARQDLAW